MITKIINNMSVEILPRFTINKCNLINQWVWQVHHNDFCPICRNSVNEDSITHENDSETVSQIVLGKCGHAFHYECINKWIQTSKVCPLCNANWEYVQKNLNSNDPKKDTSPENISNLANNSLPPINSIPPGLTISVESPNGNLETTTDLDTDPEMPPLEEISEFEEVSMNYSDISTSSSINNITNVTFESSLHNIESTVNVNTSININNNSYDLIEESIVDDDDEIDHDVDHI